MASTFLPFTTDLITALGWAILHSLWQALLIFICLRIVLKLWPHATAAMKYNLSCFSLAGIFSWYVCTFYQQFTLIREAGGVSLPGMELAPVAALNTPVIHSQQQGLNQLFPNPEMYFPLLAGLYMAGIVIMCIRMVVNLVQLQRIRKNQVVSADNSWEHYLDKLKQQLQIPRKVKLLVSHYIQVPVMIGFLKPVILMPAAMFSRLSVQQLEAILLHELAHIKRNDYILNIFQCIVETTLFFNPFVWWISGYIRIEREHCCDDMVLAQTSQPLHYARTLAQLEEYRFTSNAMTMAVAGNKQQLFYRIKRIMEMKNTSLNYSQKLLAVLIIAIGLTAIAWITPSGKEDKPDTVHNTPSAIVINKQHPGRLQTDTIPLKVKKGNNQNGNGNPSETVNPGNENNRNLKEADLKETEKETKEQIKSAEEQLRTANEASEKAIREAMKNIDWKAVNAKVKESLKAVDWKKINQEIENSMKSVDWNKINAEVNEAIAENKDAVDPEVIRQGVEMGLKSARSAIASIDMEKVIAQSLSSANKGWSEANGHLFQRSINLEKVMKQQQDAMKAVGKRMHALSIAGYPAETGSQRSITIQLEKAKVTGVRYQDLIARMASDKLIDTEKGYTIKKKNNELYINGRKQPAAVTNRYRSYLGAQKITIKGKKDNLQVNIQD